MDSLPRGTRLSNTTKTIVKICPDAGLWFFVVSKASGRSLSTTHSGRIYTYLYGKTVYIRIIRRIYTPAKIHIRCIRIRVRRNFIYTYVYIRYVYIRYVYIRRIYTYTVWANPTYMQVNPEIRKPASAADDLWHSSSSKSVGLN